MKHSIILVLLALQIFGNTSCKKEDPRNNTVSTVLPPPLPPPPPPNSTINTLLHCRTEDKMVFFPSNFCTLSAGLSYIVNNSISFLWKKISGPSSFLIEHPDSMVTKVINLQTGVYQFELTVSDANGLTDKDTSTVIVGQISGTPRQVIFSNQVWEHDGLLWGSGIVISNIYQYLPAGSVFRVYIRKDNSTNWDEVIMDNYDLGNTFSLLDGDLNIFSNYDESDTPDIKLVY